MARFTLDQSAEILPLVKAIADELVERRRERRRLVRMRDQLEGALTPEGLTWSLADLDVLILDHDIGIERASHEVECLGLSLLRQNPLTIHFPGRTRTGGVVFCWQEGEDSVCHGHAVGEEEEPRRPLRVRIIDTHKH